MDENKSRKIFIIGNGFDLNLGYPTRFKDFVDFCIYWELFYKKQDVDKYVKEEESNIDSFKLSYKDGKQINQWNRINELKLCINKDEQNELISLDKLIKNNGFIKYLKENKNNIRYERWSDFENYLLELCEMCEEHEEQVLKYGEGMDRNVRFKYNVEFYSFLKYIYNDNSYYSRYFPTDKYIVKLVVKNDKMKFIENMSNELQGFNKAFNIYLKDLIHKMTEPQWAIGYNEDTFVIDFNYTDFARKVFGKAKINYVHGYQLDNNIIIGINGEDLNREYDLLTKKYLRLRLDVGNTQVNVMDKYGRYDRMDDFNSLLVDKEGVKRIIPTYVIVIGQSLNKVDWDILIDYFNNENVYRKVIICYHNSYDSQMYNLYQMLKNNDVDYKKIESRTKEGYYSFRKFEELRDLLDGINKNIVNISIHKYDDLNDKEEKVLKDIVKNQTELVGGKKYLVSAEDIAEEEMSDILESLNYKNYIRIEKAPKAINGPRRPYYITRILKY